MSTQPPTPVLGRHLNPNGRLREVIARRGAAGSLLVLDRDATTQGDLRVVAHLAADEPRANAIVVCRDYLRNPHRRCRSLTPADLVLRPDVAEPVPDGQPSGEMSRLADRHGCVYKLAPCPRGASPAALRWQRLSTAGATDAQLWEPICVRDVIGAMENYKPRSATWRALAHCKQQGDSAISTATLRAELVRVDASHIVLNRGLREAVLAALAEGITMSEITVRCGRYKRNAHGSRHGDTSWLARRVGLVPEGGRDRPTPWVHSDVLALIARKGLGIAPHEVELG